MRTEKEQDDLSPDPKHASRHDLTPLQFLLRFSETPSGASIEEAVEAYLSIHPEADAQQVRDEMESVQDDPLSERSE